MEESSQSPYSSVLRQMHQRRSVRGLLGLLGSLALWPAGAWPLAQAPPSPLIVRGPLYRDTIPIDHPALGYFERRPNNAVTELGERLSAGSVTLDYAVEGLGYLPGLLDRLDVNVDSQVQVFSKTSLQRERISPRRPRAIYFNDEVAIGYLPGTDFLEIAAVDGVHGVSFYRLDVRRVPVPWFAPSTCLQCHHGPATLGVPGMYVGSVFPSPSGQPNFGMGTVVTDHRTPVAERWGGWYVNGGAGLPHRGNAVARNPSRPDVLERFDAHAQLDVRRQTSVSPHLSPVSDIVALMTLEHQTQMTNLLTRLSWEARIASADGNALETLDDLIDETAAYMLFANEAPLEAPIEGASTFTATFARRGPHDRQGRSLRDFDLTRRLFRFPLSYMIYSRGFGALPEPVRTRVYARLHEVLTGTDESDAFRYLTETDRTAILEIVTDTKTGLPAAWSRR